MQRLSHQAARSGARAAYQPKPKADFKEWVDPDQPGAMAPGMQAHQAALAHAAPAAGRARLCTRVTRWICGGAALLGLVGGAGWVLSGRGMRLGAEVAPGDDGVQGRGPVVDRGATERLSGVRQESMDSGLLAQSASDSVDDSPLDSAPRTLSQALDELLTREDYLAVETLTLRLGGGWSRKGLPVATVEAMVDAYRDSPHWRDSRTLQTFLEGVMLAIGPMRATDAHVSHLLRTWSWRYGEAQPESAPEPQLYEAALVRSYAIQLAKGLGGAHIPESQLRLLIGSACKEPDDIPPGSLSDAMLSRHSNWAASALLQVMFAVSQEPLNSKAAGITDLAPAPVRRCLHIFLRGKSEDRRWKLLVLAGLTMAESPMTQAPKTGENSWQAIIVNEIQAYLMETVPDLGPISTFQRTFTALYDPDLLRTGRIVDFWAAPAGAR